MMCTSEQITGKALKKQLMRKWKALRSRSWNLLIQIDFMTNARLKRKLQRSSTNSHFYSVRWMQTVAVTLYVIRVDKILWKLKSCKAIHAPRIHHFGITARQTLLRCPWMLCYCERRWKIHWLRHRYLTAVPLGSQARTAPANQNRHTFKACLQSNCATHRYPRHHVRRHHNKRVAPISWQHTAAMNSVWLLNETWHPQNPDERVGKLFSENKHRH